MSTWVISSLWQLWLGWIFLEEIKGEKLAFYTNTKGNVYFYTKNGYKEVYSSEISFNQVEMGSWYFLKELKKH